MSKKEAGQFKLARVWHAELAGISDIRQLVEDWQTQCGIDNTERLQYLVNAYASIVVGDRDAFEDFFEDEADDESNRDYETAKGILSKADNEVNEELLLGKVRDYFRRQFDQSKLIPVLGELDSILKPYGYIIDGRPMSDLWKEYDRVYGAGRFNFDSIWYKKLEPYRKGFEVFYRGIIQKGQLKAEGAADRFEDLVNAYANIISGDRDAFEDFFEDEAEKGGYALVKDIVDAIVSGADEKNGNIRVGEVRDYFIGQLSKLNRVKVDLETIWKYVQPKPFSKELMMSDIWRE